MRRSILVLLVVATPVTAALAQQTQARDASPAVAAARAQWMGVRANVVRAAEQLPESLYSYKPTPVVRTFGELFGHIAGTEMAFCAAVKGEAAREEDAVEKVAKTKAAIVQALKDAGTYCAPAYAISDAEGAKMIELFGQRSKINALIFNAVHDGEHYGNIVTYLRLKGMVPPSSQQ